MAAALATGLSAWAPAAQAERFDLTPRGVFVRDCPGSVIGCETTQAPLTFGGAFDDLASVASDPKNPPDDIPASTNDNLSTVAVTALPEPSTWALLLVCFVGLAFAVSRKRRKERYTL
jgi:hypothetical protein